LRKVRKLSPPGHQKNALRSGRFFDWTKYGAAFSYPEKELMRSAQRRAARPKTQAQLCCIDGKARLT
jgi:hypothetical protein